MNTGVLDFLGYYFPRVKKSNIELNDGCKLFGHLKVYERQKDGSDLLVVDDDNLIVDNGKIKVLHMLKGDSTSFLKYMAVGNGNVPNEAPGPTDPGLANGIAITEFTSVALDTVNKIVEFRATFNSGEFAPGSISPEEINEAALYFDDMVLFARKTFRARPFLIVDNIYLTFIWSVGVA